MTPLIKPGAAGPLAGFFYRDSTNEKTKNTAVPIHISTAALFSPGVGRLFISLFSSFFWPLKHGSFIKTENSENGSFPPAQGRLVALRDEPYLLWVSTRSIARSAPATASALVAAWPKEPL
jgi:hypothetical protein